MRNLSKSIFLIVAFSMSIVPSVYAYGSGIIGYSQSGCIPCHDETTDGTTVSITGLPDQFTPENTYLLTVNVTSTTILGENGGFDLSVTAGTLSTSDPNAQIMDGEATHKNNDARSWQVNWTAPTDVESVTFFVVGLASDGTGKTGDEWTTSSYTVIVIPEFPGLMLLVVIISVSIVIFVAKKAF